MTRFPTHLALLLAAVGVTVSSCAAVEEEIGGALADRQSEATFSLDHHDLPEEWSWIECDGGDNEGRVRTIGSNGASMALSTGHTLTVQNGVTPGPTDFVFVEPRSRHIVVDVSAGVKTVAPGGFRLTVRWGQRDCTVPEGAALFRVVPGGVAEQVGERSNPEDDFIEVTVDSLSTFAIAG